jgi:quercetin dioxygenase-like cupin family protein
MAIPHAQPLEPINVGPLDELLATAQTRTLIKTDELEVIRLVMPTGKQIDEHQVEGELTLQCIEGRVQFRGVASQCELTAGQLIYAPAGEAHSLRALADSSLLLTILLGPK